MTHTRRLFRVVVLAGLASLAMRSSALDMDGLELYLPFDENGGKSAADASGNGNDGSFEGDVSWVPGVNGSAVEISDGAAANFVSVPDHASLNPTDEISLVAWCSVATMPSSHNSIITKADTWMIHTSNWRGVGGAVDWELLVWSPGFVAWQTTSSANVPLEEWHHFAGVYDGDVVTTYIDGEVAGTFDQSGTIATSGVDVIIGRDSRACCADRVSTQTIDDAMVWSRALSKNEVNEIYDGSFLAVDAKGKTTVTWARLKGN